MKALVTGSTGFIGSHLVDELLNSGYRVKALIRKTSNTKYLENKPVETTIGDITDPKSLVKATKDTDVVFHVAAIASEWGPMKKFMDINTNGTKNIVQACVENKIRRIIHMSSCAVYGFPKTNEPIAENYKKNPPGKYGRTKYEAEKILWEQAKEKNIEVSAVRSPMIIGERDEMISIFIINALKSQKFRFIGDGNQKISISNGKDVAYLLRLTAEKQKAIGQAYNVKSFESTPKKLINAMCEKLEIKPPEENVSYTTAYMLATLLEAIYALRKKPNPPALTKYKVIVMGNTRIIDTTKAEKDLGYKPKYSFQKTIDEIYNWYREK